MWLTVTFELQFQVITLEKTSEGVHFFFFWSSPDVWREIGRRGPGR